MPRRDDWQTHPDEIRAALRAGWEAGHDPDRPCELTNPAPARALIRGGVLLAVHAGLWWLYLHALPPFRLDWALGLFLLLLVWLAGIVFAPHPERWPFLPIGWTVLVAVLPLVLLLTPTPAGLALVALAGVGAWAGLCRQAMRTLPDSARRRAAVRALGEDDAG